MSNKNEFLPSDYSVPEKPSNYMRFEKGENRFRILSSPILGWERWEDVEGGRKPVRIPLNENHTADYEWKHFWAMVVWNYKAKAVQILEVTQSTIQKWIRANVKNVKWGDPKGVDGYDFVVTRTGDGLDTEYQIQSDPKEKLDAGIMQMYKDMDINLGALFDGEDPFAEKDLASEAIGAGL